MKTLKLYLFCIFLLGFAATASAMPVWFDADGAGGLHSPVLMDELSGEIWGIYDTYQHLGGDGVLGNGDSFSHQDPLTLYIDKANLLGIPQQNYTPPYAQLYAELTGIGGTINSYDSGTDGVPTDLLNPLAILDDKYALDYTPFLGQIDFYFDTDADLDPTTGPADHIATFEIVKGGGDVQSEDNASLTADIGFDLLATMVMPGYFFFNTNNAVGMDIADWIALDPANHVMISLVDNSVNLTGFVPDFNNQWITLFSEDNGTDIEVAVVPEPGTLVLLGLGLLGLAGISRKKFLKK